MSKEYFCENIIGLEVCGEKDPEKFPIGRYSKCKKCRNEISKEIYKTKKELSATREIDEELKKLKDGDMIRNIIMKTLMYNPFLENEYTIPDMFRNILTVSTQDRRHENQEFEKVGKHITKLYIEIEQLKNENKTLRTENNKIKEFLTEKFGLNFY